MLKRRLGSTALGLDTGFRRYDDVGWLGAIFVPMTMALRRPHKGMKGWTPCRLNVDWNPRTWGLDTGPVSEYGAGFSPVWRCWAVGGYFHGNDI